MSKISPENSNHNHVSFKDMLYGETPFYHQPNYSEQTIQELSEKKLLPVAYRWNTDNWKPENKIKKIAKIIFSIIIFPIGIYKSLQFLASILIVPSSINSVIWKKQINEAREEAHIYAKKREKAHIQAHYQAYICAEVKKLSALDKANYPETWYKLENQYQGELLQFQGKLLSMGWKYKRFTVEVDGCKIDAIMMGKNKTLKNRRWVLYSGGNGGLYEYKLNDLNFKQMLNKIESNAILFNYPGAGVNSGIPNRGTMAKAYRAMLHLLENEKNGIGAKQIIGYGFSIGGGVQGEALAVHELKKNVKYVFIKDRTFSDLKKTVSCLIFRILGLLVKGLGWNIDTFSSSKKLDAPEIIIQKAKVANTQVIHDPALILGDGIIAADASLAKAMLSDPQCPKKDKVFIGIKANHNNSFDQKLLINNINLLVK